MDFEKAKYIQDKEKTLFNDLDKSRKKLKEIANWYNLSSYDLNYIDQKNIKLFIQQVNNIYAELKSLVFESKNYKLYEDLKELITQERCNDLAELEQLRIDLQLEKKTDIDK